MDKDEFLKQVKRRVAQISVGASAIRNQGASGLIKTSREYFENTIDLLEFRDLLTTDKYADYLDRLTIDLKNKFGEGGQNWGAARKGLNLFFRDVVYNKYLADFLKVPTDDQENLKMIRNLEVPLDKDVATGLTSVFRDLPKWTTIKKLDDKQSKQFQDKALSYSESKGIARVHLDLGFWRRDR